MAQNQKSKRLMAAAGFLAGLTLSAAGAFAETHDRAERATERVAAADHTSQERLGEPASNSATNNTTQQKLDKMVTNCNHMMNSMMQSPGSAPDQKS